MTQTLFLGVATVFLAIGSFLSSIHHQYTAYGFFLAAVVMVVCAVWAAYVENTPQPHLVPVQYGKTDDLRQDGLVFMNDGEPAYSIKEPQPVALGNAMLRFEPPADPVLTRLSKLGGLHTFPIVIRESDGKEIVNDLRTQMVLWNVNEVEVSFTYADARKPNLRRYRTTCRIFPTTRGVAIELAKKVQFQWWKFF